MRSDIIKELTHEVTELTEQAELISCFTKFAADDFMKEGVNSINFMMNRINKSGYTSSSEEYIQLGNAFVELGEILVKRTR